MWRVRSRRTSLRKMCCWSSQCSCWNKRWSICKNSPRTKRQSTSSVTLPRAIFKKSTSFPNGTTWLSSITFMKTRTICLRSVCRTCRYRGSSIESPVPLISKAQKVLVTSTAINGLTKGKRMTMTKESTKSMMMTKRPKTRLQQQSQQHKTQSKNFSPLIK